VEQLKLINSLASVQLKPGATNEFITSQALDSDNNSPSLQPLEISDKHKNLMNSIKVHFLKR
jgi:hypothetical protein